MELISDKLSRALNIENATELVAEVVPNIQKSPTLIDSTIELRREGEIQEDYEFVREKLRNVAETGSEALQSALTVGADSFNPRLLEAASQLMNQITMASRELIETQKSMRKLSEDVIGDQINIQNNTVYVGTAKELLEMVRETK
jgi:hypothetical protein